MGKRCTGACCASITLSVGDTAEETFAFLRGETMKADGSPLTVEDGPQIAAMLIPIEPVIGVGFRFACRHFDAEARACRIYETRPSMCSGFPYGRPCTAGSACEWDLGRGGVYPLWRQRGRAHLPVVLADGTVRRVSPGGAFTLADLASTP